MNRLAMLEKYLFQHMDDLTPGSIVLVKVPPQTNIWFSIAMLNVLLNKKELPGVYVSLGKPHIMVKNAMVHNKYNINDLVFIDTLGMLGTEEKKGKRVVFLDGPYHLQPLLDTISKGFIGDDEVEKVPMEVVSFFLLDNLEEILIYNNTTKIVHFLKNFSNLMQRYKKTGIITFYRMENPVVQVFREEADWVFEAREEWF